MLYIISLLFTILKGLSFVFKYVIIKYLTRLNITLLLFFVITAYTLNRFIKYKIRYSNVYLQIKQYKFNNKKDLFFSSFLLALSFITFVGVILYLRIQAMNQSIDLHRIYLQIHELYFSLPFGIFLYNSILFFLFFYNFLLLIHLSKKYFNLYLTKTHFWLISYDKYIKIHTYFRDNLSLDTVLMSKIYYLGKIMQTIICFGYYKNPSRMYDIYIKEDFKKDSWSEEDVEKYTAFFMKHGKLIIKVEEIIRQLFFQLHIILLIFLVLYDICFSSFALVTTMKFLPYLFIYNLYAIISQFVRDKITYDVAKWTNTLFYKNAIMLDNNTILIDDELSTMPTQFVEDFLKYEKSGFNATKQH